MATLNKTPKAPIQGNNIAPNPNGFGGGYFDTNGDTVCVETAVMYNRVVLITTLPSSPEAGAYVALTSVTGELSRVAWVEEPTGLFGTRRIKQAVKQLIKFEKDGVQPIVVTVEKPKTTVVEEPVVPPSPVEPTPAAPAAAKPQPTPPETTVYKATPPAPAPVEPKPAPVAVEEPAPVEPQPVPVEAPVAPTVEPKVEPETTVQSEPQPQPPVDNKKSSSKMSLKDIAKEDGAQKQKNKYKPGKNSRAQMLAESQRVMQQRKHARA